MQFKDYYKILGVAKTASAKEIKAAYRKLAREHHPDRNRGDKKAEGRFKEANEANEVLSDPEKRRRYDELGSDWNSQRPPSGWPGGGRVHAEPGDPGAFSDFFRTFFSGGGFAGQAGASQGFEDVFEQAGARRRASEVAQPVELTLEEVAQGTTRRLRIDLGGSQREIEVKIPAGIKEGGKVRVPAGSGHGDIYLVAQILPHATFERQGDDLRSGLSVPLTTAVLGGEAEVKTLDGRVSIKVPAHTPMGRTFRIRGQGLPRREGGRGDLLASLSVVLPHTLGPREKKLFEELRELGL